MVRRARHEESMELSSIGESVYAAEAVLKKRTVNDQEEYLIKWKGWSVKYSTWEPKENILDERLFKAFERQQELEAEQPKKRRRRRKKIVQATQSIAPLDEILQEVESIEARCHSTHPPKAQDRILAGEEHTIHDASNGDVIYQSESRVNTITNPPTEEIQMCYELASVVDDNEVKKKKGKLSIVETKPKAKRGRPKLLIKFVNKKIKEGKRKKDENPLHFKERKRKKLHWKQRAKLEAQLQASLLAAAEAAKAEHVVDQPKEEVTTSNGNSKSLIPVQPVTVVPEIIPIPVRRKRGRPRKHPLKIPPPAPIITPTQPVIEQPNPVSNNHKQRRFPDYKLLAEKQALHNKRDRMSIWRPSNTLLNSVLVTDVSVGGIMVTIKENLR
ncbi:chromobox protein homolog 6-like [Anneissia japonica]|uniref:chromobox protein homolog 6-like n=1 Tax=Anneissia japonica TaxID=1529436 RepID=UPI0014259F12|nr:chromobox protein homolog 6-like [Anneissia japonica]